MAQHGDDESLNRLIIIIMNSLKLFWEFNCLRVAYLIKHYFSMFFIMTKLTHHHLLTYLGMERPPEVAFPPETHAGTHEEGQ